MTKGQKIKVLAELDGFKCCCKDGKWDESHGDFNCEVHGDNTRWYLTSYDAIIPLIQKQPPVTAERLWKWIQCNVTTLYPYDLTAEQLSDALIKAHGKWEE